ncbi:MAG: NAD(P)-dependent oxidoreductase, partial [Candidatus Odinarchaeota archaeon]|nr:NAD(P)-dependent oxidoreductase [Candidatus Odinarchaeota archaeon]
LKMKILVTGGTGFIGRHLIEKLREESHDITVYAIDPLEIEGIKVIIGDIRDSANLEEVFKKVRPELVFHLAAIVSYSAPKELMYSVNVEGTRNVVDKCLKYDSKIVFTSSVSVIGKFKGIANEETPCRPFTTYGKTKLEAEKIVLNAHKENGLPIAIIRPAPAYGEGSPQYRVLIPLIAKGKLPIIGSGETLTHQIYVRNLIDALLLLAYEKRAEGEIFMAADEETITLKELYFLILDYLGIKREVKHIPVFLAKFGVFLSEIKAKFTGEKPKMSKEFLETILTHRHYDISKIKSIGYKPKYTLREGMTRTIEWCRKEGLV